MPKRKFSLWTLGLVVACNSAPSAPGVAAGPAQSAARGPSAAHVEPPRAPSLEWIDRVTGGAAANETLPMVIAMHGLGDRPETFAELYSEFDAKARVVLLRAPDAWGAGFSWFPFRANEGDARRAPGIAAAAERVAATFDLLAARYPTRGKPVVTGFSQGGMLSFALAVRHPERIRAAIPIGGSLPEPLWPSLDAGITRVRIVALHGESDDLVPVGPTRTSVEALAARGFDARLESFPGVGHRIPASVRARYFEILKAELQSP